MFITLKGKAVTVDIVNLFAIFHKKFGYCDKQGNIIRQNQHNERGDFILVCQVFVNRLGSQMFPHS